MGWDQRIILVLKFTSPSSGRNQGKSHSVVLQTKSDQFLFLCNSMEAASGAKDPPKKMADDETRVHRRNSQPSGGSKEQHR